MACISGTEKVEGFAQRLSVTRDELEFSISQYLDDTLDEADRNALDERFAVNAEARAVLAEYQSLQGILASAPMPAVNWDRFAAEISANVAQEQEPAHSFKISRWFRPMTYAVAASVLIAGGIAIMLLGPQNKPAPVPLVIKLIDREPSQTSPAVSPKPTLQVAVGPAVSSQDEPITLRYAESVVQRPSNALIVSATPRAQDTGLTPF